MQGCVHCNAALESTYGQTDQTEVTDGLRHNGDLGVVKVIC